MNHIHKIDFKVLKISNSTTLKIRDNKIENKAKLGNFLGPRSRELLCPATVPY